MSLADFEARYAREGDPWGYTTSAYERDKYAATLAACGPGPVGCALELGASIGVFSAMLAPRCRALHTVDAAPTAVAEARTRCAPLPHVHVTLGALPRDLPDGPFDLVVASEILYYLDRAELAQTLAGLAGRTRPGARLVAVHWRPPGPERPLDADAVHAALDAEPWLAHRQAGGSDAYRLDVWERV